jgi:hypothetical protein
MRAWNSSILSFVITALLAIVVVVSSLTTSYIVQQLENEEHKKIGIWAEATRKLILAKDGEDIGFLLKVIEGNVTIPVYMVDTNYNYTGSRNVKEPKKDVDGPISFQTHTGTLLKQ